MKDGELTLLPMLSSVRSAQKSVARLNGKCDAPLEERWASQIDEIFSHRMLALKGVEARRAY